MATPIPDNQASFTVLELGQATAGSVSGPSDSVCVGVTSDSRRVTSGNLFVALPGEAYDGHRFVDAAVAAGASAVLVEREVPVPAHVVSCRVSSTLEALGALARHHRRRFDCQVIGIAGSAGKTTTKNLVTQALRALGIGDVHASPGNLNNLVGVPFVLLGITAQHRMVVVEIGTNRLGEVRRLAELAEPSVGILTLIGVEHCEGLGGLDSIELEEGSLLAHLPQTGAVFFNADDPRVARQAAMSRAFTKLSYGSSPEADYRLLQRRARGVAGSELDVRCPDGRQIVLESKLLGHAGALASLAAFACAEYSSGQSVAPALFNAAVERAVDSALGRVSLTLLSDGSVLLDDSYNSNPASARSSLEVARELAASRNSRLLVVLGEMRELGAFSVSEHQRLGTELHGVDLLIAVAGDALHLVAGARETGAAAEFVEECDAALSLILDRARPGDVVLVKASRGVRAERVVHGFIDAKGRAA